MRRLARFVLPVLEKLLDGEANILGNEPQECRRDVPTRMERHGGGAAVGVAVLLVRAPLPHFSETDLEENSNDFARL